MKKIITSIALILSFSCLTGCWDSNELNDYAYVLGVAVDKGAVENMRVTAQLAKPSQMRIDASGGTSQKAYWNVSKEGQTFLRTLRGFMHESGRDLYFPHNEFLVVSWDAAKEGVGAYLDFFARDHDARIANWIFVARNSASEVLNFQPEFEKIPAVSIDELAHQQDKISETHPTKIIEFINNLLSKTTATVVPILEVSGDEKKKLLMENSAVFKEDKLVGELNSKETRGLLWVTNKIRFCDLTVSLPDIEGKIDLEVFLSKSNFTAALKDGKPVITITVKTESNMDAQSTTTSLSTSETLIKLGSVQEESIKGEIESAIKKAKELHADIFGFGEAVFRKYPKEWKTMEAKWDEVFQDIQVDIQVKSLVGGTGLVAEPPIVDTE